MNKNEKITSYEDLINFISDKRTKTNNYLENFNQLHDDVLNRYNDVINIKRHADESAEHVMSACADIKNNIDQVRDKKDFSISAYQSDIDNIDKNFNKLKTYCGKMSKYHKENAERDYKTIQRNLKEFNEHCEIFSRHKTAVDEFVSKKDWISATKELVSIPRFGSGVIMQRDPDGKYLPADPKYKEATDKFNEMSEWMEITREKTIPPQEFSKGIIELNYDRMELKRDKMLRDLDKLSSSIRATIKRGCVLDQKWYDTATKTAEGIRSDLFRVDDYARSVAHSKKELEKRNPNNENNR